MTRVDENQEERDLKKAMAILHDGRAVSWPLESSARQAAFALDHHLIEPSSLFPLL